MVLNTIFLVREIRRNEQHDSFINAVTHELKTPVASIRLYLQTLQTRELDRGRSGASSTASCSRTATGCCTRSSRCCAPAAPDPASGARRARGSTWPRSRSECVELARTRFHLDETALAYEDRTDGASPWCSANSDELKAAVWNLIDNAIKYSTGRRPHAGSGSRS